MTHRSKRWWPIVGVLVMLVLFGHELFLVEIQSASATGQPANVRGDRALVVRAGGDVAVDGMRLDALPDHDSIRCATFPVASFTGRACADPEGAVTVLPVSVGSDAGPSIVIKLTPPTSSPDTRRALLQVFRI